MALLLLVLGVVIGVMAAPAVALADTWTDIADAAWVTQYGVTAQQVDAVDDGYLDGSFKPASPVTRGQFTKMAVNGFDVPTLSPTVPTFSDVPRTHIFYIYVEGAYAAGLVNGLSADSFGPQLPISRQQVASILARWLSAVELDALGYISGAGGAQYASLNAWYTAEGAAALASFRDAAAIADVHKPGVAYLAAHGIAKGTNGYFAPTTNITRAQAAVLIIRTLAVAEDFEKQAARPTVTSINPDSGPAAGGTVVTIYGTNFTSDATSSSVRSRPPMSRRSVPPGSPLLLRPVPSAQRCRSRSPRRPVRAPTLRPTTSDTRPSANPR
ncbi:MAG: S-layer homology domain-containing protein [Actinomycetia bacterium]|nr:S-layer homology domain-containing protein [Actinomycetes bacterium]